MTLTVFEHNRIKQQKEWTPKELVEVLLYDINNNCVSDKGGTPRRVIVLVVNEISEDEEAHTVYSCGMNYPEEIGYIAALKRRCMQLWYKD
jgi:hypothetical protein